MSFPPAPASGLLPESTPTAVFSSPGQAGPPRPRTLHFFRSDAQLEVGIFNADIYASIVYGVGGIQNQFFCDWTRGGQLSLVCVSLRVEAVIYKPGQAPPYLPPGGTQTLGCLLSETGSAPPRPPTFTTQSAILPDGAKASFLVPDFARWVFPGGNDVDMTASTVDFRNLSSTVLKTMALTPALAQLGTPLPGGTSQIDITNHEGGFRNVLVQFELGL